MQATAGGERGCAEATPSIITSHPLPSVGCRVIDPRPVGTEEFASSRTLLIRLNHARVTFAVESHRQGTDVGRFFPTEAVRSWVQMPDQWSREGSPCVVFPKTTKELFRVVASPDTHIVSGRIDRSQIHAF